ncbi:hypothetical protein WJX81_004528 [Elliptochloris bilobata]|uniref:Ubiquitin-like protease family profile domain-containing protein n=1 Tax=Elliptochloris bilobata TaxID=381761 RepID=A0AAW1S0T8_9CHLO
MQEQAEATVDPQTLADIPRMAQRLVPGAAASAAPGGREQQGAWQPEQGTTSTRMQAPLHSTLLRILRGEFVQHLARVPRGEGQQVEAPSAHARAGSRQPEPAGWTRRGAQGLAQGPQGAGHASQGAVDMETAQARMESPGTGHASMVTSTALQLDVQRNLQNWRAAQARNQQGCRISTPDHAREDHMIDEQDVHMAPHDERGDAQHGGGEHGLPSLPRARDEGEKRGVMRRRAVTPDYAPQLGGVKGGASTGAGPSNATQEAGVGLAQRHRRRGRSATLHLGEMVVFHRALAADGAVVERTFGGASDAAGLSPRERVRCKRLLDDPCLQRSIRTAHVEGLPSATAPPAGAAGAGKTSTAAFAAPEAVASGPGKGPIGGAVQEDARPTSPTAATGPAGAHESAASPQAARTAAIRGPSPALAADEANVSREEFDAHEDDFHTLRPGEMAATKMVDLWMARLQERDLVQSTMGGWGTKAMVQRSLHVRYFGPTFCSGLVGSDPPYERWTDRRLKHAQVPDIHTFDRLVFVVHVPMHYIVVVVGPGERGIVCYDSYAGGGSPYGGKHYQGAVQSVQRFVRAELSRAKGSDEGLYDIRFAAFREKGTFDEDG